MERLLAELQNQIDAIYGKDDKILVFGEGALSARVMLIGEAPGEQETLQRRPFVGKAGKNLDEFLQLAQLNRSELYVTNTVKFRPTRVSKAGRIVNRPPTKEEIELFRPFLLREIEWVHPEYVVTLGNVPLQTLTNRDTVIGAVHGQVLNAAGFLLYPMYHPASMIYNPTLREVYRTDVLRLAELLNT